MVRSPNEELHYLAATGQSQFDDQIPSCEDIYMQTEDPIPQELRAPVAAARDWINSTQERDYEVTGLVDVTGALEAPEGSAFEVGLVPVSYTHLTLPTIYSV